MRQTVKIGVIINRIEGLNPKKDTSLAMIDAALVKGWKVWVFEDLAWSDGHGKGWGYEWLKDDNKTWKPLDDFDVILMRKDPPFDIEYIMDTYLLEGGPLVINRPSSLRDVNEKVFTTAFPQCCPKTLLTRQKEMFLEFLNHHRQVVLKPTDGMGGRSVYRVSESDSNAMVIFEDLSRGGRLVVIQEYVQAIETTGDKRVFVIHGEAYPYALTRHPAEGQHRGNLAVGALGKVVELSARDRWICDQVKTTLVKKGLLFVGLDIIGDYLTEINVTSPTCVREIEEGGGGNPAAHFIDGLEKKVLNR